MCCTNPVRPARSRYARTDADDRKLPPTLATGGQELLHTGCRSTLDRLDLGDLEDFLDLSGQLGRYLGGGGQEFVRAGHSIQHRGQLADLVDRDGAQLAGDPRRGVAREY